MEFEVLVNCALLELVEDKALNPASNKSVVSLINDFEDGKWRAEKFDNFVWDNIAETALSLQEREALRSRPSSLLREAAKKLRLSNAADDIGRGSELAEIVLYGILKHHYKALSAVPKIFYKQNSQDYAKGSDSVHIVVTSDTDFTLWLGEAKFYKSIEDVRLASIIESVKSALATDKLRKENAIIVNVADLERLAINDGLKTAIRAALSNKASIDELKPRLNIPILLLHECSITANVTELTDSYRSDLTAHHADRARAYFIKQIAALKDIHKYAEIRFHLILFPVPEKETIVERFVNTVTFHKA